MKLKSLLLGSAAALALTSGALAADPRSSFVSLDVCDAYGITGLTIASSDTCLKISGQIEYSYAYGGFGLNGADVVNGSIFESEVDWRLQFEATTQTDAGAAKAVIRLVDVDGLNDVAIDRAYVSFGDTTVLTAGLTGSLFARRGDQHILTGVAHARVAAQSHSIQVAHDLGNGWKISGGLEGLELAAGGLVGVRAGYSSDSVKGSIGVVVRNGYDVLENNADADFRFVGDISADFGDASVYAEFNAGTSNGSAVLSAAYDLGVASLRAGVGAVATNDYNDVVFRAGAGLGFALTDTIDLDLAVIYNDESDKIEDYYLDFFDYYQDSVVATLTATAALSDTLSAEAWAAVGARVEGADRTTYAGGLGLNYKPGGGFELGTGVGVHGSSNDSFGYAVHFSAKKSF